MPALWRELVLSDGPLLRVENLVKLFPLKRGMSDALLRRNLKYVHAVEDVSISVMPNETLAVVGESGSGKTTLGLTALRLVEPTSGRIYFDGHEISSIPERSMRAVRRYTQVVFQDPSSSLDPHHRIFDSVAEPLVADHDSNKQKKRELVAEALKAVGLSPSQMSLYPHQFSGGQRQRISLARAIILKPKFIVLDEPTSSLDASVQSQILLLLQELQRQFNLSYMLITHNISVANYLADKIAVMYLGKIVEVASAEELTDNPMHPYTQMLVASVLEPTTDERLANIEMVGEMPSSIDPPEGCRFSTRCPYAKERCHKEGPEMRQLSAGHFVMCHFAEEIKSRAVNA